MRTTDGVQPVGAPIHVSRKKAWVAPLVSPGTRLSALDVNTTNLPSALTAGDPLSASASVRFVATLDLSMTPTAPDATDLMVKFTEFEVPPPGDGLDTPTSAVPAVARSVPGMAPLTCVLLRTSVGRLRPFHSTEVASTKLVPLTASGKPGHPAGAVVSDSDPREGSGLLVKALIVNAVGADGPAFGAGFTAVTCAVPWEVTSVAGI